MKNITVTRKTTESVMSVKLNFDGITPNYRQKISTGIVFLNHMIEHIVWRSEVNIEANVTLDKFNLAHVVCEDLGITLGKAVAKAIADGAAEGISGYGHGVGMIDEAKSTATMSFESRAYFDFSNNGVIIPETVEGMASEDLVTFLEGFAQGACCTLHIDVEKGKNAHHIWEAVFRAFGICLKNVLLTSETRKNMTSGVAGKIEFIIE